MRRGWEPKSSLRFGPCESRQVNPHLIDAVLSKCSFDLQGSLLVLVMLPALPWKGLRESGRVRLGKTSDGQVSFQSMWVGGLFHSTCNK